MKGNKSNNNDNTGSYNSKNSNSNNIPLIRVSMAGYETNNNNTLQIIDEKNHMNNSNHGNNNEEKNDNNDKKCEKNDNNNNNNEKNENGGINKNNTDNKIIGEELGLEYRLNSSILPIRCYLDSHFISFLKDLNKSMTNIMNEKENNKCYVKRAVKKVKVNTVDYIDLDKKINEDSENKNENKSDLKNEKCNINIDGKEVVIEVEDEVEDLALSAFPYFQHVWIAPIHMKIDYEPGNK